MTDAERAVIDAARAWADEYAADLEYGSNVSTPARVLYRAVRALPRPLSEQLAELRVGDVVEFLSEDAPPVTVLCVDAESQIYFGWYITKSGKRRATTFGMEPDEAQHIRRIISNPEADRG